MRIDCTRQAVRTHSSSERFTGPVLLRTALKSRHLYKGIRRKIASRLNKLNFQSMIFFINSMISFKFRYVNSVISTLGINRLRKRVQCRGFQVQITISLCEMIDVADT